MAAQAAVCSWHHPPVKLHWRTLSRPVGAVPAGVLQSDTKRGSPDSRGAACCCHQLAFCLIFRLILWTGHFSSTAICNDELRVSADSAYDCAGLSRFVTAQSPKLGLVRLACDTGTPNRPADRHSAASALSRVPCCSWLSHLQAEPHYGALAGIIAHEVLLHPHIALLSGLSKAIAAA